ncbi:MAG TPA: Rid family hydrolase [Steroidobacteraceae bacterium]|nr:Rid family hydrolase [Steroidobacteraceae bacterium]
MRIRTILLAALLVATGAAHAAESEKWPMIIPAPHGSVILPDKDAKDSYDEFRYAAARRVDNTLYISGVVIGPREGEKRDAAAFKQQVHRGFLRLKQILEASGASFKDVVMINSFHVWESPYFEGTKMQHFGLFEEVADTYLKPPYPAWTAVGTTGLLGTNSIVEVQLIARLPTP